MQVAQQRHIQLFEHDSIRVGEERNGCAFSESDLQDLLRLHERQYPPFLQLIHRGMRTLNYVGIVQTPGLCLEILPKTERKGCGYHRQLLLSLLQQSKKIPALPVHNSLGSGEGSLSDHFVRQFLEETEKLCKRGLTKRYRRTSANSNRFRGKMLVSEQLRHNHAHKERVFAEYQAYDENHLLHAVLREGLEALQHISIHPDLKNWARQLNTGFPGEDQQPLPRGYRNQMRLSRQDQRYATALSWANLILEQLSPVMKSGAMGCQSFLFDMQQLFEKLVAEKLAAVVAGSEHRLHIQPSRNFWRQRKIRPDMVLETANGDPIILDTKWKLLKAGQPDEADLKQMYIYNHYFKARRGFLIYPKQGMHAFGDAFRESVNDMRCEVIFADLADENGLLNPELGPQVLQQILRSC